MLTLQEFITKLIAFLMSLLTTTTEEGDRVVSLGDKPLSIGGKTLKVKQ